LSQRLWQLLACGLLALLVLPAAAEPGNALVFGGTGRLGAPIVRLLVAAGHPVTVFARPDSDRRRLAGLELDYVTGDLTEVQSVLAAVGGRRFSFVIDASARRGNPNPFYGQAMKYILAAIADSQVRQFILHGSVGAGENRQQFPGVFERMEAVMQAKGEAEDLLRASGITYTIIRNGIVQRDGTAATGTARLSKNQSLLGRVTRLDLARLTMECLDNEACANQTFHAVDDSLN